MKKIILALTVLAMIVNFSSGFNMANAKEKAVFNINTATIQEIAAVINIIAGIDLCHKITQYRLANGPFKKAVDLLNVEGIDDAIYNNISNKLTLEI